MSKSRAVLAVIALILLAPLGAAAHHAGSDYWLHCTGSPATCVEQAPPTTTVAGPTTTVTTTVTTTAPAPAPVSQGNRGILSLGVNAWSGADPVVESKRVAFAVFHAPEAGADDTARRSFETSDPDSLDFVYQNFGMSCDDASWTTCGFSTTEARTQGFTAKYAGVEAKPSGYTTITSINMGKAGYGLAWAQKVRTRLCNFDCSIDGVFFDDVNIADSRLPNRGVPDGYASSTAYKDAVKAQLQAAQNYLASWYKTMANVGGIPEWEAVFQPADDVIGITNYSLIEFCGQWASTAAQYEQPWARMVKASETAAARGQKIVCGGFGNTEALARFNDYWSRILGAFGTFSDGNDYRAPFPYFPLFANDYGTPTSPIQRSGAHAWRSFSNGTTLHVDLQALTAWTT